MEKTPTPLTSTTLVYTRMRDAILSGELEPGQKLRIDAMRERFGAGASPVREALNRLVSEELVVFHDLRGFFVVDLDEAALMELFDTRIKYFAFLLRDAIANGDAEWEERVIVAFHRMNKTPRSISTEEFQMNPVFNARLHEFYTAVFSGCGSRLLTDFAIRLLQKPNRFFWLIMKSKFESDVPESMRPALVDAILARDADRAVQVMTNLHNGLINTYLAFQKTERVAVEPAQ
jgi:DNA-binding GntR family transcriptional regulator